MKDDLCLDCILKSQNTRSVPLWQKNEGNDSLLPEIIRDDLYNPLKTDLQKEHPKLTKYKTKLKLETDKPSTWIFYWAANSSEDPKNIVSEKRAYNTYTNHGLIKTDKEGNAELILNCPQPYKIGNITYPRHVHYTFLLENIWSEQIHSTVVMCSINYRQMETIVDNKSHFIVNALDNDTFHIPNSLNLHYDTLEDMSRKERKKYLKDFFLKHTKKYPELVKIKRKQLPIVVYCANTSCGASHKLTRYLIDAGYVNVIEYTGGIKDWKSHQRKDEPETEKPIHSESEKIEPKVEETKGDDISQFANYKVEVKVDKQGGGSTMNDSTDESDVEEIEPEVESDSNVEEIEPDVEEPDDDSDSDIEEIEPEVEEPDVESDVEEIEPDIEESYVEEIESDSDDEPIIEDDDEVSEIEEEQDGGGNKEPSQISIDYSKYGIIFI